MSEQVINNFAQKLYSKLAAKNHENFFISPFSISTALSMCYAGAKNETAKQLKELLHVSSLSDEQIFELNQKYLSNINQNLGSDVTINTANKIYPMQGFDVKKEYLDVLTKNFHSDVQAVDFAKSNESASTINQWVAERTREKIKNLISPDALNCDTRMVLVNAIYFKGNWMNKFDSNLTEKVDFTDINGKVSQVDMMHMNGKKFNFYWHPNGLDAESCTFPYVGDKIAMTVILPEVGKSLDEIENGLTAETLNAIYTNDLPHEKVNLQLPKFKLEYKTELSNSFKEMGANLPFDNARADFTGINDSPQGLYISKVVHQAVVEVNEEGTEAAAATGVIMMTRMAIMDLPRDFICNRPFIFIIHEKTHNTTLFIGKYVKPQ